MSVWALGVETLGLGRGSHSPEARGRAGQVGPRLLTAPALEGDSDMRQGWRDVCAPPNPPTPEMCRPQKTLGNPDPPTPEMCGPQRTLEKSSGLR